MGFLDKLAKCIKLKQMRQERGQSNQFNEHPVPQVTLDDVDRDTQTLTEKIMTNSGKKYEVNKMEEHFIKSLVSLLYEANISPKEIYIERMSDGTLNFTNNIAQIGRIKLQGRATKMQVLRGQSGVDWYENKSLDFYIDQLPKWVKQIKYNRKGELYNVESHYKDMARLNEIVRPIFEANYQNYKKMVIMHFVEI